uniref:Uncharacterized protein n=1 Tax=Rhizophora mucronata TaxID=61149 RepID=A0A2P2J802_RHIMU
MKIISKFKNYMSNIAT